MERTLATLTAAWLETNRPAETPAGHAIAADHDTATKAKPITIVRYTGSGGTHPKLREYQLELRTEYLPDADTPAGTAAAAHAALVDLLGSPDEFQSLRHDLAQQSLLLRKLVPGPATDEPFEDRARLLVRTWTAIVQTAL